MRDAWLDLVLGSTCAGCSAPGRVLCDLCAAALPRSGAVAWPTPSPSGLATPMAAGEYDGLLKLLVNAHKEHRCFALARPLGLVLAHAVLASFPENDDHEWVLVPVPSKGNVVRFRGHDPMLRVTRRAAVLLRRWGHHVAMSPLLRTVGAPQDQTGLDAEERAANLSGTMLCRRAARSARRSVRYLVTDDVITTGATAREAQRALEAADLLVSGIAAVAATRKRLQATTTWSNSGASLPISTFGD